MTLLERIFAEPELRDAPPVLVDVGAAGGVPAAWRKIARFAIGVGFEPDARETAPLGGAERRFLRWIFCPTLAVPQKPTDGQATLHLTESPQCSSSLPPQPEALGEWAFAGFFQVKETRRVPATTLVDALGAQGLGRIDWLKCDTQGLDLQLFQSLPEPWRERMLAVEFEPGLIDAYRGEDKLGAVLGAMANEPFWLAALEVGVTPRVRAELVAGRLGEGAVRRVRQLAPGAPAWANARYLRRVGEGCDRRAHLLGWVFAELSGQPGGALEIAEAGARRFGGELFEAMAASSVRSLGWAMLRGAPRALWRRLRRGWAT